MGTEQFKSLNLHVGSDPDETSQLIRKNGDPLRKKQRTLLRWLDFPERKTLLFAGCGEDFKTDQCRFGTRIQKGDPGKNIFGPVSYTHLTLPTN